MALIIGSSSPSRSTERDRFSEWLKEDQITNMLDDLKKEVSNKDKDRNDAWNTIDTFVEDSIFDKKAEENRETIQKYIKEGNYDAIKELVNKRIDDDPTIRGVLNQLKQATEKDITFQLNTLQFDILKDSISGSTSNTTTSTPGMRPRDNNPDMRGDRNTDNGSRERSPGFIEKYGKNARYQSLNSLIWNEDIDKNGNGTITKKELKQAGIIDRYRQSNKDVREAVQKIINWSETEFKRKDVRGVNRQDLTTILTQIMEDYYLNNHDIKDTKEFRKYFKDTFIKTDLYKKTGAGAKKDMNRILAILEAGTEDPTVQEALNHLADMGKKAKNINIVGASNDLELLKSGAVNKNNVFLFLCDFDGDGTVNSTNITKQKPNHSRRDTGSVMGLQLYQNFAARANLDKNNNIINGPKTALLIKNIILGVQSKTSAGSSLARAIDKYSGDEDKKSNGGYTIESFLKFMGANTDYSVTVHGKKFAVVGVTAVKSYLESLANETNEGSGDVADIFVSKQDRANNLKEKVKFNLDASKVYAVVDKRINASGHTYEEAELAYTRRTVADQILQGVNYFTDSLYMNLDTDRKLAQLFYGTTDHGAIGKVQQTFYFPDGTRNEQLIKDKLGEYINTKIIPSLGFAADEKGNPILGGGLAVHKLSGDLSKRFQFQLNVGATLPVFNRANNQIPSDFRLGISIEFENTRQTKGNRRETENQARSYLRPVTRVGFVAGAGFEFITGTFGAKLGLVVDRDFPAAIEQQGREFDRIMRTLLDPTKHNFQNAAQYTSHMKNEIDRLSGSDKKIQAQKNVLYDFADELGQKMERAGVFDILNSAEYKANPGQKTTLLNFFYNQFIDGFHENAINQNLYNQLAGQGVKVTKVNIGAIIGLTIAGLALIPPTGGASTALIVAGFASMRLSTFRNSFVADRNKTIVNYDRLGMHKNMDVAPEFTNLQEAAQHLEQQINALEPGKQNILKVTADESNGTFRIGLNPKGLEARGITITSSSSILQYLNLYYSPDAAQGFRFHNGELILGQADVHIGRLVKRDRVEFHVMLGNDVNNMTKIDNDANTDTKIQGYEKTPESPKPLTREVVVGLVDGLSDVGDKEALINLIWDKCKVLSPAATRGEIVVKNYPDGSQKVEYKRDESSDKLTLRYEIIAETGKKEWKEFSGPYIKEINLGAAFNYVSEDPNSYEKLRIDLDTLGKNHSRSLFDTADAARKSTPDLLLAFLAPLSALDYTKASNALLVVLEKKKIPAYEPFITKLKNPNLPKEEHILLCNKFRHLLAYNATSIKLLTGSGYSNINKLGGLMMSRQSAYESMANLRNVPSVFRKNGRYYTELYNKTKDRSGYELADAPHISGYTAFYRTSEKHFGVAHPGETKLVKNGDTFAKIDVKQEDIQKTADRYFANLEKNPEEFAIIQKTINDQLKAANVHLRIRTVEDLKKLILGKTVSYENKQKTQKETLTFDSKFVFYLMGECTNESIGLEFGKIKIRKDSMEEGETIDEGKTKISSTSPGKKPAGYKITRRSGLYNNEYDIQTRQRDLTIAAALRSKRKHKEDGGQNNSESTGGQDNTEGTTYSEDSNQTNTEGP